LAAQFTHRHIQPDPREQAQLQALITQATQAQDRSISVAPPAVSPERAHANALTEQYLAALAVGDREGMRAASMAFAESAIGQQVASGSRQRVAALQQQLPGRDNPPFLQALQHLEQLGPETARYSDRADMERIAGAIVFEAKRNHMPTIDQIIPTRNGDLLAAWAGNGMPGHHATIDPFLASAQPLERSFQQLMDETQRQASQEMHMQQHRQISAQPGYSR
jgi:hypothetical protein